MGAFMNRTIPRVIVALLPKLVPLLWVGGIVFCFSLTMSGRDSESRSREKRNGRLTAAGVRSSDFQAATATLRPAGAGQASSPQGVKNQDASQPARGAAPSEEKTPPAEAEASKDVLEVVLSFDDGPHVEPLGIGRNHTEEVLATLKDNLLQKDIKAVFFVQTHAPGRGGTQIGRDVIAEVARRGHVVGIHTGSARDHASHCMRAVARPYDANENAVLEATDGANGLESDMVSAKSRIQKLTGNVPLYVRPTYGERNRTVRAVYRRQGLKMILWDIDGGDNAGAATVDEVNQNIAEGVRRCVASRKQGLIVLFHDINLLTAANLEEYIANICISARKLGKTVVFPTSAERVMQILDGKVYE